MPSRVTASNSAEPGSAIAARDRLIVALDFDDAEAALALVDTLGGAVSFYKVGYELFLSAGWPIVETLAGRGHRVFLDLKMDDVDVTIEKGVRAVAAKDFATFLTITGSRATAQAARRGREGSRLKILQVTLLTSLNANDLNELKLVGDGCKFASEPEFVRWRAGQSLENGCDGLIASGQSAKMLREAFGDDFILVCPGIRPAEDTTDDHKRPCTPSDAFRDGADYIVVGRPIRNAPDPRAKAERIIADIQAGLDAR